MTQAAEAAYAGINENLRGYYIIYACITMLSWLLALAVLHIMITHRRAEAIQERLHACTSEYLALHRRPYDLSFSTGIAIRDPESPCDLDDLMERADRRMYESKSKRRDQVSKAEMLSASARYTATKN